MAWGLRKEATCAINWLARPRREPRPMSYRLKLDEPIDKEVRRIGLEEIERAATNLRASSDANAAVHASRKNLKRLRALLRLIRFGLDDGVFDAENQSARDIGRALAPARDAHVRLETLLAIESAMPNVANTAIAAARKIASEDVLAASPPSGAALDETLAALDRTSRRWKRLKLRGVTLETLSLGLTHAYRQSAKRMQLAIETGSDDAVHEWRKSVQVHWRHMALFARIWPDAMDARVSAAKRLSQLLGDDHDLAMLISYVEAQETRRLAPRQSTELIRLARARQAELRNQAWPQGRLLFAAAPKSFAHDMLAMWRAARDLPRKAAPNSPPAAERPRRAAGKASTSRP